ncbi:MAG: hypothetical protein WBH04_17405 [Albidovulum sp.]
MTDEPAVSRKLAALGADKSIFRQGARVLSNGKSPTPLAALLDEVDNTVLKRDLTFRLADSLLSMTVAGRRVLTLVAASQDLSDAQALIALPLSHDEPEGFTALTAVLQQFTGQKDSLTVESAHSANTGSPTSIGIPVSRLAEALGLDLDAAPPSPLQMFLDACGMIFIATLTRSGEDWTCQAQDDALLPAMRHIAETQLEAFEAAAHDNSLPALKRPRLITIEGALEGAGCLSATWANGECALMAHDQSDLAEIHAIWRGIFAP